MTDAPKERITISTTVNASAPKVWEYWTKPEHMTQWNQASDDWYCPRAENDLTVGGKLVSRMEAKDGSMGFEFGGTYDSIEINKKLAFTMGDGRKVEVIFTGDNGKTTIVESFDPESSNPVDMQRAGWQAILDSFKRYIEGLEQ